MRCLEGSLTKQKQEGMKMDSKDKEIKLGMTGTFRGRKGTVHDGKTFTFTVIDLCESFHNGIKYYDRVVNVETDVDPKDDGWNLPNGKFGIQIWVGDDSSQNGEKLAWQKRTKVFSTSSGGSKGSSKENVGFCGFRFDK